MIPNVILQLWVTATVFPKYILKFKNKVCTTTCYHKKNQTKTTLQTFSRYEKQDAQTRF